MTLMLPVLLALSPAASAESVRLEVIADTSIAAYAPEVEENLGGRSRIRIKGIQHFMLARFDLAPIRGKDVQSATLHLRLASDECWLKTVGLSTISADWDEGTGQGEPEESGCCFRWAAYPDTPWAGPQSDFTDVSFGLGNTRCAYTDVRQVGDGWLEIDVPDVLVYAMASGDSYGLVISDEKGQTGANNDVWSREQSSSKPYLTAEVSNHDAEPPAGPRDLVVEPLPSAAHLDSGAMRISFTRGGEGAFTYEGLLVSGGESREIPRWAIPHAVDGGQEIALTDLPPDVEYRARMRSVDRYGNRSQWAEATGRTSPALEWPANPDRRVPAQTKPRLPGTVYACPATVKMNPRSGYILEEMGPETYGGVWIGQLPVMDSRYVWDRVDLMVARGGFASFQVIVQVPKDLAGAEVSMGPFACDGGEALSADEVEFSRVWYVEDGELLYPEVAVPTDGTVLLPAEDNAIADQLRQAVWVDLYVPPAAAVGRHASEVRVQLGDQEYAIPVAIDVLSFTYPDALNFNVDLNGYGPVGGHFGLDNNSAEYRVIERKYHRLAHAHRATLDILGYSQSGNINANYAPPLEGRGADTRIVDWTPWDEQFGPYFSGEAFAGLPRDSVPLNNFYLALHEDWPGPIEEYYDAPEVSADYPRMVVDHAMRAAPVEEAFSDAHRDAFRAVSRQLAEHIAEMGWTDTEFHCYQNNKHYFKKADQGGRGTSWWLLDEPSFRDDWLALEYFAGLFAEGIAGIDGPRMVYREDLSRPQWQRQWLADTVGLMVISRQLFDKHRRCLALQRDNGATIWNYGSGNAVGSSNLEAATWPLRAYLAGADAIVPWNTIGGDGDLETGDPTAILYPGKRFGIDGPVASLRLKAWRDGAQDVEALIALGEKQDWNREQLAAAIWSMRGRDPDPEALALAPWAAVEDLTVEELHGIREQVLRMLSD